MNLLLSIGIIIDTYLFKGNHFIYINFLLYWKYIIFWNKNYNSFVLNFVSFYYYY